MKKLLPLLLSLLFALTASAQVVQKGIAVEYNEKAAKTALAGVEFRVQRAGSTASDAKGAFVLDFPTLKAGDLVAVRRIEKSGYEIFNKEAVEQWNINPSRAFTVVMCRSDKFKALKDRYYSNSEERYAGQYRSAKAELERLKKEGKLKEQEYFSRLREVEAEYEKKLDNLDNYVDRFARIDLSELNAEEQAIIDLVQSGQIDEAIARYEKINYLGKALKGISDIKEIDNAVNSLNELREGKTADRDVYLAGVERTINTMLLAGDSKNNATIAEMYTTIADADTTNIDWLNKTGEYLNTYIGDYNNALKYFQTALNVAKAKYGEECLYEGIGYYNMGRVYYELSEEHKALFYFESALAILKNILSEAHSAIALCYDNIGGVHYRLKDYSKALEYCKTALKIETELYGQDDSRLAPYYNSIGLIYNSKNEYSKALEFFGIAVEMNKSALDDDRLDVALCYNNIGLLYYNIGDYPKSMDNYEQALCIFRKIFGENHPIIARICNNMGNTYCKMWRYSEAIEYHQKALSIRKKTFGEVSVEVAESYGNLGKVYDAMEDYDKSLEYLENALSVRQRIVDNIIRSSSI